MHVKWQDYLESTPAVLRGRPRIKSTRIPVSLILGYLAEGDSAKKSFQNFPISLSSRSPPVWTMRDNWRPFKSTSDGS